MPRKKFKKDRQQSLFHIKLQFFLSEKGHWDIQKVWVAYHECRKCGFQTEDDDVIALHIFECDSTYTTKEKQVEKKTWVVDVPAHKECDRCHVTQ